MRTHTEENPFGGRMCGERLFQSGDLTIHWSLWHSSSAKLVQYNGVKSLHSNAKFIELLEKDLPLLCSDKYESIPVFPAENQLKKNIDQPDNSQALS